MKIRNKFVSNSSSSSFCIMGVSVSNETYEKVDAAWTDKNRFLDAQCSISDGGDEVYIGAYPYRMKEDETLSQFKQRIVDEAKNKFDIDIEKNELGWIIDGGYDG